MDNFIQEAHHSIDNVKALDSLQEHEVVASALEVMAAAFLLEAQRQREKHAKLQAYLSL